MKKFDFSEKINQLGIHDGMSIQMIDQQFEFKFAIEDQQGDKGFKLSYLIQMDYKDQLPPSVKDAPISFKLEQDKTLSQMFNVGDKQTQTITIENLSGNSQGMVVAQVSIPSCLEVDFNQLEILKESSTINNFEVSSD